MHKCPAQAGGSTVCVGAASRQSSVNGGKARQNIICMPCSCWKHLLSVAGGANRENMESWNLLFNSAASLSFQDASRSPRLAADVYTDRVQKQSAAHARPMRFAFLQPASLMTRKLSRRGARCYSYQAGMGMGGAPLLYESRNCVSTKTFGRPTETQARYDKL